MASVINMQFMRYINLFSKISNVSTTNCFVYNGQIFFAVNPLEVSQAIGRDAVNVRKLREILRRKIKVVAMPDREDLLGIEKFIKEVIEPIEVSKIDVRNDSVSITAGRQSKAALIGRNRLREKELSDILKNYFHIPQLRIL
jgi:transcription termination/antitermination protein NusA